MPKQTQITEIASPYYPSTIESGCIDEDGSITTSTGSTPSRDFAGLKLSAIYPCAEATFPPDFSDNFKKALCFTETGSKDDPSCKDNARGKDGDMGRYQMTPLFVKDLFDYYCKGPGRNRSGSGEYKTVCEELKASCKSMDENGNGDASCVLNNPALADRMMELWFTGRWPSLKKKKDNETYSQYLYRLLQIFHCGNPKGTCGGLKGYPPKGGPPPCDDDTPGGCDYYFFKFYCKWVASGGQADNPPPFPQSWCSHYGL